MDRGLPGQDFALNLSSKRRLWRHFERPVNASIQNISDCFFRINAFPHTAHVLIVDHRKGRGEVAHGSLSQSSPCQRSHRCYAVEEMRSFPTSTKALSALGSNKD